MLQRHPLGFHAVSLAGQRVFLVFQSLGPGHQLLFLLGQRLGHCLGLQSLGLEHQLCLGQLGAGLGKRLLVFSQDLFCAGQRAGPNPELRHPGFSGLFGVLGQVKRALCSVLAGGNRLGPGFQIRELRSQPSTVFGQPCLLFRQRTGLGLDRGLVRRHHLGASNQLCVLGGERRLSGGQALGLRVQLVLGLGQFSASTFQRLSIGLDLAGPQVESGLLFFQAELGLSDSVQPSLDFLFAGVHGGQTGGDLRDLGFLCRHLGSVHGHVLIVRPLGVCKLLGLGVQLGLAGLERLGLGVVDPRYILGGLHLGVCLCLGPRGRVPVLGNLCGVAVDLELFGYQRSLGVTDGLDARLEERAVLFESCTGVDEVCLLLIERGRTRLELLGLGLELGQLSVGGDRHVVEGGALHGQVFRFGSHLGPVAGQGRGGFRDLGLRADQRCAGVVDVGFLFCQLGFLPGQRGRPTHCLSDSIVGLTERRLERGLLGLHGLHVGRQGGCFDGVLALARADGLLQRTHPSRHGICLGLGHRGLFQCSCRSCGLGLELGPGGVEFGAFPGQRCCLGVECLPGIALGFGGGFQTGALGSEFGPECKCGTLVSCRL